MSNGIKILIGAGAFIVLLVIILFSSYIGAFNSGNSQEQGIDGAVKASQTSLSTMTQTVMEMAQVEPMYREALKEVITAGLEGRYGEDGADGLLIAITEAYPGQLDSGLYTRIQDAIESGRRNFADSQNNITSRVQNYKTDLGSFWTGFWLARAGYPRIDLTEAKYNPIINNQTRVSFDTGIDTGIQLPGRTPAPAPAPAPAPTTDGSF